jgi:hypothetical protein
MNFQFKTSFPAQSSIIIIDIIIFFLWLKSYSNFCLLFEHLGLWFWFICALLPLFMLYWASILAVSEVAVPQHFHSWFLIPEYSTLKIRQYTQNNKCIGTGIMLPKSNRVVQVDGSLVSLRLQQSRHSVFLVGCSVSLSAHVLSAQKLRFLWFSTRR